MHGSSTCRRNWYLWSLLAAARFAVAGGLDTAITTGATVARFMVLGTSATTVRSTVTSEQHVVVSDGESWLTERNRTLGVTWVVTPPRSLTKVLIDRKNDGDDDLQGLPK